MRKERSTENSRARDDKSDQLVQDPVSVESATPARQIQSEAQTEINYNVAETTTTPARTEDDTEASGNRAGGVSGTSLEQVSANDTAASGNRTEEISDTAVEQVVGNDTAAPSNRTEEISDTDRAPVTVVKNVPKAPPAIKQEDPVQPSMFDREQ